MTMLCLFLNLGGAGQRPLRGDVSPFKILSRLSRNERLSRKNKKLLYSDGRNCPEVLCLFLNLGGAGRRPLRGDISPLNISFLTLWEGSISMIGE